MVLKEKSGWMNIFMERFSIWFASPIGVMETFIVIAVIVILEKVFPNLDHNGFWLLYWLTVYSGVTQPVLAYAATISAYKSQQTQEKIKALQETQNQLLENNAATIKLLMAMSENMKQDIGDIADDVDDLKAKRGKKKD